MRHRPAADGRIDHGVVGLLSMLFAVLVGIGGGALSLLLRWPGLEQAGALIRQAAHAHVPLLVFFAAIPASLGGLAVAGLPGTVGADRSAMPLLDVAALGSTVAAFAALLGGACGLGRFGIGASANLLALSAVLSSASLITTALLERRIRYADLPSSVWFSLIAASLALCAAPIMAAACSIGLWRGDAVLPMLPGLVWPALSVVLVLLLGVVTDSLAELGGDRPAAASPAIPVLLGSGMLAFFMTWAFCRENRIGLDLAGPGADGLMLLLVAPVLLWWARGLIGARRPVRSERLPVLFSAGFAVMLPVGLVCGLLGVSGHEAVSLAIVFGVLAGFFRLTGRGGHNAVATWSAQAQFWLLLGGGLSMLVPLPPGFRALGAAMSSLCIALFMLHLVAALMRFRPTGLLLHPAAIEHAPLARGESS